MSKTRITVLVENTAHGPKVLAEHGLSYWIEHHGKTILLDTGQGCVIAGNAYKMGIPLYTLDALVLSHGHYDHTGGAAEVLKGDRSVTVYAHPKAFAPKFTRVKKDETRSIGMPHASEKAIRETRNRLFFTTEPTVVFDGLIATGPVPRVTDYEDTGGHFFLDEACTQPDPIEDDQSVFFDTPKGTVVVLGCAHSGVINTLLYVRKLTDNRPIHAVIGGMHLVNASVDRIQRTIEAMRRIGVERLAPAHCTGMPAVAALWNAFPGQCQTCPVGTTFKFDE